MISKEAQSPDKKQRKGQTTNKAEEMSYSGSEDEYDEEESYEESMEEEQEE